ncbi:MAG: hypothetical protein GF398_10090 [Chitinivibrionales bacterium]|nr:hypothetical protein [Chitinivibrionales bacterium]
MRNVLILLCLLMVTSPFAGKRLIYENLFDTPEYGGEQILGESTLGNSGLNMEPDSRIRMPIPQAYEIKNGVIEITISPPALNKMELPTLSSHDECHCAFKVCMGRVVAELSDRWVKITLLNKTQDAVVNTFGMRRLNMTPDGTEMKVTIHVEDQNAVIKVNGMEMLAARVHGYNFHKIDFCTYKHAFTLSSFTLSAIYKDTIIIDKTNRRIDLAAQYWPSHFNKGGGLKNHFYIVSQRGKASVLGLFTVHTTVENVYQALRTIGATPGNNIPPEAWTQRTNKTSTAPAVRANGDSMGVEIVFGGREFAVKELLSDTHGKGFDFRFSGGLQHVQQWETGAIVSLQSSPGSIIGNRSYTISNLVTEKSTFEVKEKVPFVDGDEVIVRLSLPK